MVKEYSLFGDILDEPQPLMVIKELGLEFWHPNSLSEETNIKSRLNEKSEEAIRTEWRLKNKRLEELKAIEPTEENLEQHLKAVNALDEEVYKLTQKLNQEVFNYIALTAKLPRNVVMQKIEEALKAKGKDYNLTQAGTAIYYRILGAAKEYNEQQAKKDSRNIGSGLRTVEPTDEEMLASLQQQLAIFRHFYHMSRQEALGLPHWEFQSLLEQYEKLKAAENADLLMAINAGFNGGDDYYKELVRYARPYQPEFKARELPAEATFEDIYGFSASICD